VTVAAPVVLAAAIAFALFKQRKMTGAERRDLREAVDSVYLDDEDDDGCPVRVDVEKRDAGEALERRAGSENRVWV
jgi:hypothetical protein